MFSSGLTVRRLQREGLMGLYEGIACEAIPNGSGTTMFIVFLQLAGGRRFFILSMIMKGVIHV